MPNPPRRQFRDLPVSTLAEFDSVSAVRSALREMELGIFARASALCDAMGRDDRVEAGLGQRVQGLLGCPVEFEARGDARRAKAISKELDAEWWRIYPEANLAQLLQWGIALGIGIGEHVWERTENRWEPRLKVWHPQYLSYRWDTRSYWIVTQDGQVEVTPGDGKWVLHAPYGLERGWMKGAVRRLAIPWLIRQWARRDWARYSEVHGLPTKKAKVPAKAQKADKDRFLSDIENLGSEPEIILPQGANGEASFDLELLEATANTWEGFQKLLEHCDASISITLVGQNLTTQVNGGSRAAAEVHDGVKQELKEFDAAALSTTLYEQGLRPWALFNHGDVELAPYPVWQTDPPADEKAEADTLGALGDALQKLDTATAGTDVQVDTEAILDEFNVPTKRREKPAPEPGSDPVGATGGAFPPIPGIPFKGASPLGDPGPVPREPKASADERSYSDDVVEAAVRAGTKVMKPTVEAVLERIEKASTFDEIKGALPELLSAIDPAALEELTKNATLLALLAGRHAVRQET